MWTGRHVIENRWILEGNAGETGATYQWLLSLLHGLPGGAAAKKTAGRAGDAITATDDIMNTIDGAIAEIEPGSAGISSFLGPSFVHMANFGIRTGGLLFPYRFRSNLLMQLGSPARRGKTSHSVSGTTWRGWIASAGRR